MTNSDNRHSLLPVYVAFCTSFLIAYYIILIGENSISLTFTDIIIFVIIIPLSLIIVGGWILYKITKRNDMKLKKREEKKEFYINKLKKHKKELVDVLKELNQLKIKRDDFTCWKDSFNVCIDGLDDIKERIIYWQAEEHLKSYPNIYRLWVDSNNKIIDLNIELKNLREYISGEIDNKLGEDYVKLLRSKIWCIIERAFSQENIEDTKNINKFFENIKYEKGKNKIHVIFGTDKSPLLILCRNFSCEAIIKSLSELIDDLAFRNKIKNLILGYLDLKGTFDDKFKTELGVLLQDVDDGDEDKLKGECDKCKLWVKEIG